jgi:CRP-like cAMP-binding protein
MFSQIRHYYQQLIPNLQDDDWAALEAKLTVQQLKKGDYLLRAGEVCRYVSFVNRGLLRMFYLVDGKEINVGFASENDYLSQYDSFLLRTPSAGQIDVLEDCELLHLSYNDMQAIYLSHPVFERFGRRIAEQLFILVSMQTNRLLTLTPEERYAELVEQHPELLQRVPQYMIASYIGITPEHLSRIRKKLAQK